MPHIVIEHSDNVDALAGEILRAVHTHVSECGLFDPQAVKGRSLSYQQWVLPENALNFMHITVSILEGRTQEERAQLSAQIFQVAKTVAPELDKLSVDIAEMVRATYSK